MAAVSLAAAGSSVVSGVRAQPGAPRRPAASVTSSSDSATLEYVCGDTFRFTHTSALLPDAAITWRGLPATTSGGAIQLYRRLPGRATTEAFFTAAHVDTVEIAGFGRVLRAPHRKRPPCTVHPDTSWVTSNPRAMDYTHIDTTLRVGNGTTRDSAWGRTLEAIAADGVSRDSVARTLAAFDIRVSATTTFRLLYLRVDRPRRSYAAYTALIDSLNATGAFAVVSSSLIFSPFRFDASKQSASNRGRAPSRKCSPQLNSVPCVFGMMLHVSAASRYAAPATVKAN